MKKKLLIGLIGLLVLAFVVLIGILNFDIDVAQSLWALAGIAAAYILYVAMSHAFRPKKEVMISTKVELSAPPRILRSVKNYRLKVSSEKHIEEKGQHRTVKMDELIMSFNSSDHPNAYEYCMQIIGRHMDSCLESAREAHPGAKVTGTKLNLPPELKLLEEPDSKS